MPSAQYGEQQQMQQPAYQYPPSQQQQQLQQQEEPSADYSLTSTSGANLNQDNSYGDYQQQFNSNGYSWQQPQQQPLQQQQQPPSFGYGDNQSSMDYPSPVQSTDYWDQSNNLPVSIPSLV